MDASNASRTSHFSKLGFSNVAALYSSVITNAALLVGALISMAFVDKFGRRAFFLEAGAEMHVHRYGNLTFRIFCFLTAFYSNSSTVHIFT